MRRCDPLIVGAGPAGCAAAITLAKGGTRPVILEKSRETGDALCGGFLSWQTVDSLRALGVEPQGHRIDRLRGFSDRRSVTAPLPQAALGVSRHALDSALIAAAVRAGAGLERGVMVRHLGDLAGRSDCVFLATGKSALRGAERPRTDEDPAMGLRIRLSPGASIRRLIGSAVELHMFDRGYAGVALQEDGSINVCLSVRKSLLSDHGREPRRLLRDLGASHPAFGDRLEGFTEATRIDAVAAVPYGWRATRGTDGLFRLGDQAGVIPSFAGEGIGIALSSGRSAAMAFLDGGATAAAAWQVRFSGRSRRPIGLANALWRTSETRLGRGLIPLALSMLPCLVPVLARATRIGC